MKQLILASTLILILVACKKDKNNVGAGGSPTSQITITGITPFDNNGNQLGPADTTDWTKETNWSSNVINLFSYSDTIDYNFADTATIIIYPMFPNPVDSISNFRVQINKRTVMKLVIVDEQLNVLEKNTFLLSMTGIYQLSILFNTNQFQHGKFYRLYYSFYDKNKIAYYRGHGDIKLN